MKNKKSHIKAGFTVVELLVAMTITITIVGLLVFVARTAFSSLSDGTNDISSSQSAQTVLEQITADFESMEYRTDQHQWLSAEAINTIGTTYTSNSIFEDVEKQDDNPGFFTRFAFFTKPRDRYNGILTNPGDIACVEYGIGYKDLISGTSGDDKTFVLYRQLLNPDYTFQNLLQQMDEMGTPNDKSDDEPENLLDLIDGDRSTANDVFQEPTNLDDPSFLLCDNIKEFSLTFHVQYPDAAGNLLLTKVPILDVNNATTDANKIEKFELEGTKFVIQGGSGNSAISTIVNGGAGRIVALDINLQVINEDGVALLNAGAPADVVEKHVERFTKTINLPLLYGNSL